MFDSDVEAPYEARFSRQFIRATKRLDRHVLTQACRSIVTDPYNAAGSHLLRHEWVGFRGADFDGRQRIIYRVCEECRRLHNETRNPLACCADVEGSRFIVTFVDFGDYHASAGRRRLTPSRSYDIEESEN